MEDSWAIEWDPKYYRLRCIAHIFNLAAKAFLFDSTNESLSTENNLLLAQSNRIPTQAEVNTWRRRGCLGKIHNFNVALHASNERMEKWEKLAGVRIPRDNDTRWGSWEAQISAMLSERIQIAYAKWWDRYPDLISSEDKLNEEDWVYLKKISTFLTALTDATSWVEGSGATLERVLPTMEYILKHFEDGKVSPFPV